jgi:hypothetical protein
MTNPTIHKIVNYKKENFGFKRKLGPEGKNEAFHIKKCKIRSAVNKVTSNLNVG